MARFSTLLFVIVCAAVKAAEYREASTGMLFPEHCDAWTRTRIDENAHKGVGVSVAYAIQNSSVVTCRVFDGQFGPPSEDPAVLRRELEAIAAGVVDVWQKMGAQVELGLPVGPLPNDPKQFVVAHRIYTGASHNISISIIQFRRGRYLSFRFTTQGYDGTEAFHALGRFFAALHSANRNSPNPESSVSAQPETGLELNPSAGSGLAAEPAKNGLR